MKEQKDPKTAPNSGVGVDAIVIQPDDPAKKVLEMASYYETYWQDRDDQYWLRRFYQEASELTLSLDNLHNDSPEHELTQLASICINWLRLRNMREAV